MTYGIPLTRVVAYTYGADIHCTDCAEKRFGSDEHGHVYGIDWEGNEVGAIFVDSMDDRSVESCGTCRDTICLTCGDTVEDRELRAECSNCHTAWFTDHDEIEQD